MLIAPPLPLLIWAEVDQELILVMVGPDHLDELFCVMPIHSLQQQEQLAVSQLQFQADIGTTTLLAVGALLSNGTFCIN